MGPSLLWVAIYDVKLSNEISNLGHIDKPQQFHIVMDKDHLDLAAALHAFSLYKIFEI